MAINNFRIILEDAHPENSVYCMKEITIENTRVLVQCEVVERLNVQVDEAFVFVEINQKWISAVYEKSINPSIDVEYYAFMDDLRKFVRFLINSYRK